MDTKMIAVRAGHKGAVTKLLKKFEEIQQSSEADYEEISTLLEVVTQKKRTLENINEKILEQTSDEDVAVEILESDEYMFNLEYKLRQITKLSKSVQNQSFPANEPISSNLNPHADNFIQSVPSTFISQPSTSANQQYTHSSNSRASCKQTPDSASLNDCLLNVPPKLNEVTTILLRFRLNKYAVSTDIEKAFLNVGLDIEDRDVTRFFWLSKPTDPNSDLTTYRFKSVLFGATCSPFILNAVLSKHLNNHPVDFTDKLTKDLYVDNIVSSFESEEELLKYFKLVRSYLQMEDLICAHGPRTVNYYKY
ncbi:Hypothetical predicted protein [Mytilus galloprovincialis]|uniref:Reverse transcriptase domain-containing protein n=1 Tax=Mytilus galloprovincialis TaxID=29158 RepID=A0A8B6FY49_MYTGA|nr:Hypothetical predicted protein [Mytilus galloprovincialis]